MLLLRSFVFDPFIDFTQVLSLTSTLKPLIVQTTCPEGPNSNHGRVDQRAALTHGKKASLKEENALLIASQLRFEFLSSELPARLSNYNRFGSVIEHELVRFARIDGKIV